MGGDFFGKNSIFFLIFVFLKEKPIFRLLKCPRSDQLLNLSIVLNTTLLFLEKKKEKLKNFFPNTVPIDGI